MRSSSQQVVLYCFGLHTENSGLREVDLEPCPKTGSEKINMLKQGRNISKESKSYRTAWTQIWIPALREGDLEPSAKRGTLHISNWIKRFKNSMTLKLKNANFINIKVSYFDKSHRY